MFKTVHLLDQFQETGMMEILKKISKISVNGSKITGTKGKGH